MYFKHLFTLSLLFLISQTMFAQDSFQTYRATNFKQFNTPLNINTRSKGFSMEKFTMGIKGGVNFSLIIPLEGNSIFSSTNGNPDKDYSPFYKNFGYQMGFIIRYNITRDIKISIQPSMNDYSFKYSNEYSWQGVTNLNYLAEHHQNLRFFELPLILGFYYKAQKWQPYLQAGAYYARLMNSNSHTSITETSDTQSLNYTTTVNSNNIYNKNQYGVIGGGGLRYAAGRTLIGIEANYRVLLSEFSSTASRYGNNQVTGNYDITDKLLLNNIAITLNITVPLVCSSSENEGPFIFCKSE
ncbi:MAG: hypothetical protein B6I20_11405 [Bacteroidetes bacterium 4572_117]|nr:MAG: hypothetical protein B6I20_11405 [Bacteroidetes bacterium 4572_117]